VTVACPEAGAVLYGFNCATQIAEGDYSSAGTSADMGYEGIAHHIPNQYFSKSGSYAGVVFSELAAGSSAYQDLERQISEEAGKQQQEMFYSGTVSRYDVDDSIRTYRSTVCSYNVIREEALWEKEGFGGVVYQYAVNSCDEDKVSYEGQPQTSLNKYCQTNSLPYAGNATEPDQRDAIVKQMERDIADNSGLKGITTGSVTEYTIRSQADADKAYMIFGSERIENDKSIKFNNPDGYNLLPESLTDIDGESFTKNVEKIDDSISNKKPSQVNMPQKPGTCDKVEGIWNSLS
jgi:hypothetical protein